jgi:T5SS/PEP-CTERM-associated repeat protein
MLYRQLIAIIVRLLHPRAALAPCRVVVRKSLPCVVCLLALCGARDALATVAYTGVVYPVDNPFDTRGVTGIPKDGNDFFLFEDENHQTYYEGYHFDPNTPGIPGDDTNINFNVIVGAGALGTLQITEVALRDMNLVIGDIGRAEYSGSPNFSYNPGLVDRVGTGVVRITGLGAVYNNDFTILASGLDPTTFNSAAPRADAGDANGLDGADDGFDVYIGRAGNGTLEISVGGRAEIHDAVFIGAEPASSGNVIVDGFDSILSSSGLGEGSTPNSRGMYVGYLGTGIVTVRNGGTIQTARPVAAGGDDAVVAAVIGGGESEFSGNDVPDQGGTGTVTVTGVGSKWLVGGTLQIGGFNLGTATGTAGGIDFTGANTDYNSEAGRGTLNVLDSGLVNITLGPGNIDADAPLYLAVGRFGRINLGTSGLINIGNGTTIDPLSRHTVLMNDGVISGSGRIQTGVFDNRYLGEVRVGAGEKLIIDAASEYNANPPAPGDSSAFPDAPISPHVNYGVIQVFGTVDANAEIEFDRSPTDNSEGQPGQPMRNERVARPTGAPLTDFYGGLISAQHSILRFRSGLINTGMMAFTAGNNYVTGNVLNADVPASPDDGIITISGPGTKVTFENDLLAVSPVIVGPGASLEVLARHSFITAGDLKVTLDPDETSNIFVAGDAGIAGQLSISLNGFGPGDLSVGDSFQIMTVGGNMGGVDLTNPLNPKIDFTVAPLFSLVSFPNLVSLGLPATTILRPVFTQNSVLVVVASAAGAIGPDFNGDGVVNGLDLNVWLANVGITSGASVVQGDADADGDVDGDDFLFWQRNVGKPGPWFGSGAGSGSDAAVPEPASLALLLISAVLSLGYRPRR